MKLNVDGAMFFYKNKASIGFILRDSQGVTCLAASLPEEGICEPKSIELTVILQSLQIFLGMFINKLILESDCLFILLECQSRVQPFSDMGSIVSEIRKLKDHFEDC